MGQARPVPGDEPDARDDGAAALEFALVSPLLFTLLFMIFSAGWGLWEYEAARATAREAVRLASVGIPDVNAYRRGVACLGERNGMRHGSLTEIKLTFHSDATLGGLLGAPAPTIGGYVEVRLTFTSALQGILPSPFTDDQGRFTTGAASRIEQLGISDLQTGQPLTLNGQGCA